ncbi:sulfotransferase family cytosolic 1B member 1 [Pogonomyrmex barbatus]|uniref:Sulfotransferase family cytosolic 1B member 1 n=1 Tax=Pogonomyrmex barbatus TaxID=144034 RepID=A0A6I9WR01_9HYME|nr:sulfotransferase family cytosolic 1B member 1 [Pogonomyrmex barbatus]
MDKNTFVFSTTDDEEGKKLDEMFGIKPTFLRVQPSGALLPSKIVHYAQKIRDFQVYEDDIWLISYPRTGSHWAQEMVWCIEHDFDYETTRELIILRTPLLESSILIFNEKYDELLKKLGDSVEAIAKMPRPRYIKSHLPWDLLPKQLREKKPKTIYITRNPKDTCVSFYHYCTAFHNMKGSFDDFAELMLQDSGPMCPFWNHIMPFWKMRDQANILFLTYEEMKRDQTAAVKKAAKFLGKDVTNEQIIGLCEHLKFSKMSTNPSTNLENMELLDEVHKKDPNFKFIRNGKVGDWTNYMSEDLSRRFDKWTEEHLRGEAFTGLKFNTDVKCDEE